MLVHGDRVNCFNVLELANILVVDRLVDTISLWWLFVDKLGSIFGPGLFSLLCLGPLHLRHLASGSEERLASQLILALRASQYDLLADPAAFLQESFSFVELADDLTEACHAFLSIEELRLLHSVL